MKKILLILSYSLIFLPLLAQYSMHKQVTIQMDDQAFLLPLNSLPVTTCKSLCKGIKQQGWGIYQGSCIFSSSVADSVSISNFSPGYLSIYFFCIDTTGSRYADTLTLQFLQPPPCPVCPTCPVCPVCPPAPPDRTVTSMSWISAVGKWLFTFSAGATQIF